MYDEDSDPELESHLEVGKENEEGETKRSRSAKTKLRKMSEVRLFQMWKVVETAEDWISRVRSAFTAGESATLNNLEQLHLMERSTR